MNDRALFDADGQELVAAAEDLGRERNLVFEIGCCRIMMQRLMREDVLEGDPRKVSLSLRTLNRALLGATRVQWQIEAAGGSNSSEALTALLTELERG